MFDQLVSRPKDVDADCSEQDIKTSTGEINVKLVVLSPEEKLMSSMIRPKRPLVYETLSKSNGQIAMTFVEQILADEVFLSCVDTGGFSVQTSTVAKLTFIYIKMSQIKLKTAVTWLQQSQYE